LVTAAALGCPMTASTVDEDLPHPPRGHCKKVSTILDSAGACFINRIYASRTKAVLCKV
jgi:hypothetical protein